VAVADIDGDGLLDVVFIIPVGNSQLLLGDGTGQLQDSGLVLPSGSSGAAADIDLDGDIDLVIGRGLGADDVVLRNRGDGSFDTETLVAHDGDTYGLSFGDLDGDGDPDLFAARFLETIDISQLQLGLAAPTESVVFENWGGTLVPLEGALPDDIQDAASYQGQLLDADGDGDLDIYLTNDFGMWLRSNRLLLNDGSAHFTQAPDCGCELSVFGMGTSVGDVDQDGDADLFTTNLGGPVLQLGEGDGTYYDATLALGADLPPDAGGLASWGSAMQDLDGDGYPELAVAFGQLFHASEGGADLESYAADLGKSWVDAPDQPDVLLHNEGGQGFTDISEQAGFQDPGVTRDVAVGDLDRDGRPDLITAGVPFLRTWRTGGGCGPGVTIRFDGLSGVGLRAEVQAGGLRSSTVLTPSTTFSSSAEELYLGLGGASAADRIRLLRGATVLAEWTDVAAGTVLDMR